MKFPLPFCFQPLTALYSVYSCTAPESGRRVSKTVVRVSSNETAGLGGGAVLMVSDISSVNTIWQLFFEEVAFHLILLIVALPLS